MKVTAEKQKAVVAVADFLMLIESCSQPVPNQQSQFNNPQ
jgi:hypothetical protein